MKHERNISPPEGVVQASTTWSAGLHRFLPVPIKHGRKLTTKLSVTTNSLSRSNIGRFTRYGKNIFALRGTLGFKDARDLLHRISEVDAMITPPPFEQKRHIQLKTTLTTTDHEWLKTIVDETSRHDRQQRDLLLVCQTRLDAKTINKQIQRVDPTFRVHLCTDGQHLS